MLQVDGLVAGRLDRQALDQRQSGSPHTASLNKRHKLVNEPVAAGRRAQISRLPLATDPLRYPEQGATGMRGRWVRRGKIVRNLQSCSAPPHFALAGRSGSLYISHKIPVQSRANARMSSASAMRRLATQGLAP